MPDEGTARSHAVGHGPDAIGAQVAAGRVVCLGHAMIDVHAMLLGPLAVGSDTPAQVRLIHGGSAANTAAWLAVAGVRSVFLGRVGADVFGRDIVETLSAQGVEPAVTADPSAATGVCLVLVGPDGERSMIPSIGANANLSSSDVRRVNLGPADRLHVSGYAVLDRTSRPAALQALAVARASGAGISVDAASAAPIRKAGAGQFLGWLPPCSVILANQDEAAALTGVTDPNVAARQLASRFAGAVVKCGAAGAVVAAGEIVSTVTAPHLSASASAPSTSGLSVLDSTGAGDAFAAGLLAALHRGESLIEAARQGNLLGARAVSGVGARPLR
jgi:sugar/nucleoside kinase (ribokinase family)